MRPRSSVAQAPVDNGKKPRRPPKKRARGSDVEGNQQKVEVIKSGTRRAKWQPRPGKLAALMNLPLDVLFEVFGHLNPLDILRLARTTKEFRRVLMHRSSMSVWKNARDNVPNMPDCPPFWTEPHYANLAFDPHCHECGAPGVRNVDWRIGRRICTKCSKTCMVDAYHGESVISGLVPSKYGKRGRLLFYRKDVEEVQKNLHELAGSDRLEAYREERRAFVKEMETQAKVLEAWAASQAKDRSDQLEDARRDRKSAIIERLTEIGWGAEIEHIPYTDDLSHHKLVKQPTRLTDRIWNNIKNDMIKYMEEMRTRRLERERRALLIARKRTAIGVLRSYKIAHLPFTDVMPEAVDFCSFPEVIEIVGLPTETEVTEASFANVASNMDDLVHSWRTRIHSQLRARVRDNLLFSGKRRARAERVAPDPLYEEYVESLGATIDVKGKKKEVPLPVPDDAEIDQMIPLATTVFRCKTCTPSIGLPGDLSDSDYDDFLDILGGRRSRSIPLFYPKVMGHCCLTRSRTLPWDYFATDDPNFRIDFPMSTRTKWNTQLLQVDEEASKAARTVVEACGEDPLITTATKMDELDPRLACLDCMKWSKHEVNQGEVPVFTWRSAVQHRMREHRPDRQPAKWKKLEGELLEESNRNACEMHKFIIFDFQPFSSDITHPASTIWLCVHCMDLPQERECYELGKMKNHLSTIHGIEEPVENEDYYKDYEVPQGRRSDFKLSDSTVTLQMERPPHVPLPGRALLGFYHYDDEDDEEDEEDYEDYDEDDFYFGDSFFPFF